MSHQELRLDYKPTPQQLKFHLSTADEMLYGGAAGGGKSHAAVMDAFNYCLNAPGFQAYLFRRTFPELEGSLIEVALRTIPDSKHIGKYNATSHTFKFNNGSSMRFRQCQNENAKYNYQGVEIHGLYIDEATHFTKSMYDMLKSRVRAPKLRGVDPLIRLTSNPGGIGHGWIKSTFITPMPNGGKITVPGIDHLGKPYNRTYEFIPAKLSDNPHLGSEYGAALMSLPKAMREAYLDGSWDSFSGQVFTDFVNDPKNYLTRKLTHVIEPFDIPDHWPRYFSFDYGYYRPFSCGWWAADTDGRMYRYREWYGCEEGEANKGLKLNVSQICQGILDREKTEKSRGIRIRRVGDPAIWQHNQANGQSIGDVMAGEGVFIDQADHSRLAGKAQFHQRLRFDGDGFPYMYVFRTCKDFIRTIPELVYSERRPEDVDTEGEDHIYDEAKYFFMSWPMSAREAQIHEVLQYSPLNIEE